MLRRLGFFALILAAMAVLVWSVYPIFLPTAKKVSLRQEELLAQVSKRKWDRVNDMMWADYKDGFGLKRDEALQTAKELLGTFLTLQIDWKNEEVEVDGNTATVTGILRLQGTGPIGANEIIKRVNEVQKPWTFQWKKHPVTAEWKLSFASNPELGGENLPP